MKHYRRRVKKQQSGVMPQYENLVLEGGGVHGIGYIGCLKRLEHDDRRKYLKRFGGASVGTLVGFGAACNVKADDIMVDAYELQKEFLTGGIWPLRALYNFLNYWGLYDMKTNSALWIEGIFKKYCGDSDITFQQLYDKFGNDLYVAIFNRTTMQAEIISRNSHPDVKVMPVLIISMSVPGVFMPGIFPGSGDLCVDGGTTNNFPIWIFDEEDGDGNYVANPLTLGIRSVSDKSIFFAHEIGTDIPQPITLMGYLEGIIEVIISSGQQRYEKPADAERTYFMKMPHDISSLNFSVSNDRKRDMFKIGYDGLGKFLRTKEK